MNMKVAHYTDEEGFAQNGELVEGVIERYYEIDPRTGARRNWGFVRLANGSSMFFHNNNLERMQPYCTGPLTFIPGFTNTWQYDDRLKLPAEGDKIVGIVGKDRHDRSCLIVWSYLTNYEKALASCEVYVELTKESLERDPDFRCEEIRRIAGSPDRRRADPIFEGKKKRFEERYPLGAFNKFNRKDPLLSETIGDVEYIRWFERKTATIWEKCEDPRTMKFQLPQNAARLLLRFESTRMAEWPVWQHKDTQIGIAHVDYVKGTKIVFPETANYLETVFEGKIAQEMLKIDESNEDLLELEIPEGGFFRDPDEK